LGIFEDYGDADKDVCGDDFRVFGEGKSDDISVVVVIEVADVGLFDNAF